jgi:hypothetical protein
MALDIDGSAVLRSIVQQPDAFPDVSAEINKVARALVAKQLKAKATTLDRVRRVQEALGEPAFKLIIDGLTDAEAKSLAAKLDKSHPDLKAGTAAWRRGHIVALAAGAEPAAKPDKPKKVSAAKKEASEQPASKRAIRSKALAAVWDGKNVDDEQEGAPQKPAGTRSPSRR